MSEPAITFAPHSRDDVGGDGAERDGAVTAAEMLRVIDYMMHSPQAFLAIPDLVRDKPAIAAMHRRDLRALEAVRDFILSQSAADLPPADRATAQPPAAEVRANCGAADGK